MRKLPLSIAVVGAIVAVISLFAPQDLTTRLVILAMGVIILVIGLCTDYLAEKIDDSIAAQPKKPAATQNQSTSTEK